MFAVIITILLIALSILYDYVKNKRKFELIDKFPGPVTHAFVGNAFNYAATSLEDVIKLILESHQTYGHTYRTKIYNETTVWTCDMKIISTVLSNNTQRVHFISSRYSVDVFSQLVEKLKLSENGDAVDVLGLIYLTALDNICEIGCGERVNALNDPDSEFVKAVTEVMDVLGSRFSNFLTQNEILFNLLPWPAKGKYNRTLEAINKFSNKVILKRHAQLINKSAEEENGDYWAPKIVFVDLLLKGTDVDGKSLGNDAILDQVNTLLFNGRNSSPVAIAFVLYALGQHSDIQQKVFYTIKYVMGSDKNEPITEPQLHQLKYLDCVIKEAMRMYPPIPAIARYLEEDIILDDGRIIPADSSIALTLFAAFRNPSIFPEPNEFIPDRFDQNGGESSKIDPLTFIPFSSGPRNCIGQKYALLLIKTTVVQVLRHYEVIPKGVAPILCPQIVLRSKNVVQIGLRKRVY